MSPVSSEHGAAVMSFARLGIISTHFYQNYNEHCSPHCNQLHQQKQGKMIMSIDISHVDDERCSVGGGVSKVRV